MDIQPEQPRFPRLRGFGGRPGPGRLFAVIAVVVIAGFAAFFLSVRSPSGFVPGTVVTIPAHASTREAGVILERARVVRSGNVFQFIVKIVLSGRPVIAGDFQFDRPHSAVGIARLVTGGGFGGTQAKITIPEGTSAAEIARIVGRSLPSWDADAFVAEARPLEGSLFPETYIVFKSITPDELVSRLRREYELKVAPLRPDIGASGRSESDVIIMASLLEKEAKNADEAKVISGILWKRISRGIPLQVDAPFLYTLGKTSSELTASDLRKDGPYNTYTRKGLPAGPIGNSGIAMIRAAIAPDDTPYLYYLHDASGTVHYAKTYAEHLANVRKYLDR